MRRRITDRVKRACSLMLSLLLCTQMTAVALAAEDGIIRIDSAAGLLALAEQCSLDTWSRGKTVVLTADISLSGAGYTPIPTFGGIFDGAGHTVTGLALSGSLSPAGFFWHGTRGRCDQESAGERDNLPQREWGHCGRDRRRK